MCVRPCGGLWRVSAVLCCWGGGGGDVGGWVGWGGVCRRACSAGLRPDTPSSPPANKGQPGTGPDRPGIRLSGTGPGPQAAALRHLRALAVQVGASVSADTAHRDWHASGIESGPGRSCPGRSARADESGPCSLLPGLSAPVWSAAAAAGGELKPLTRKRFRVSGNQTEHNCRARHHSF